MELGSLKTDCVCHRGPVKHLPKRTATLASCSDGDYEMSTSGGWPSTDCQGVSFNGNRNKDIECGVLAIFVTNTCKLKLFTPVRVETNIYDKAT